MNRPFLGFGLVVVLVVTLGVALMWYLTLGSGGPSDESIESAYVSQASVATIGAGIDVDAAGEAEAYYILGYTHGIEHPWTLSLLRQTALGRLSEWFDEPTVSIDRLTRSLAIPFGAKAAARELAADDRQVLKAYAQGVSDAFETRTVLMNEHLVLFNVVPERWEDWHSIAIERLFAWLSEPPQAPSAQDTALAALQTFQQSDEALRKWLHLHGFEHSAVWSVDDSAGTIVQARFVYGASSLAHFVPTSLAWPGVEVRGVSLLGTPILPFVTGPGGTSVTLLSSRRSTTNRFIAGYPDSVATEKRYERIVLSSGAEHLVTIPYLENRLFFSSSSLRSDLASTNHWGTLSWVGLEPLTDLPAWRRQTLRAAGLESNTQAEFRLLEGVGLTIDSGGNKVVRGRAAVEERSRSSIYLAIHPLGRYAAQRFMSLAGQASVDALTSDVTSAWAEANVGTALGVIDADSALSPVLREAVDYLRNWDYRYNLASIGAPIFDAWMGAYTSHSDPFPTIRIAGDSLARVQATMRLQATLVSAVDSMARVGGNDLARWRLEAFRTGERFSPVWSFEGLEGRLPGVDPRRYAPLTIQQRGHPTTIAWESGLFDYPQNSPSHVLARARIGGTPAFSFRPDYLIGNGLIARHVVAAPQDSPTAFPAGDDKARLTFRPRN